MLTIDRWMAYGLLGLLLSFCAVATGQDTQELRVGVTGSEPFVMNQGDGHKGLSIDVWEKLAVKGNHTFNYHDYRSVSNALRELEAGDLDVVIGPISITSGRQKRFEFTQPYFSSSLGIVSRDEGLTLWGMIRPFFSMTFFVALGVFLVILTTVGFLVWAVERRSPDGPFSEGPVKGMGNGIWLALVTMTTVGYGDLAPKTMLGRVVLGGWMVVALLSATSMLAGLAGTIALSGENRTKVELASDLAGMKVAVVKGSPGEAFVTEHGGRRILAIDLGDAMKKLENKEVSVVVFDRPQLRYYLSQNPELELRLSTQKYQPQGYGFAFQKKAAIASEFQVELLRLKEEGFLDEVEGDWLPTQLR